MPKNNKENFLLLGIIILLLIGVAGTTVYFLTKKTPPVSETPKQEVSEQPVSQEPQEVSEQSVSQEPEETTSTQPENLSSTNTEEELARSVKIIPIPEIDTSDWNTFRNLKYGFEIKYPAPAELIVDKEGNGFRFNLPGVKFFIQEIDETVSMDFELDVRDRCGLSGNWVQIGKKKFTTTGWSYGQAMGVGYLDKYFSILKENRCFYLHCSISYVISSVLLEDYSDIEKKKMVEEKTAQAVHSAKDLCTRIVSTLQFIE